MYIEEIIDMLDNVKDFCSDIVDESKRNTTYTLIEITKQKVKNLVLEGIEIV